MQAVKPGLADDSNFEQHWTVDYWRSWSWPPEGAALNSAQGLQVVARVRSTLLHGLLFVAAGGRDARRRAGAAGRGARVRASRRLLNAAV
jgi:hypothetical protein